MSQSRETRRMISYAMIEHCQSSGANHLHGVALLGDKDGEYWARLGGKLIALTAVAVTLAVLVSRCSP